MKTIQIASIISIALEFVGCQVVEREDLREDLLSFGLICVFALLYSSHLVGLQNEKKNEK
jgi:hypothetical protein